MRNILSISKQVFIYFFIILFAYAAVSKLTDFENFKVQVAQSPLLSAFATFIAYAVVIGELVIALMLCFVKSRTLGLYFFLGFMTAFTVYIYLILNYSPFVPCSCGGILEKMGWREHLWFNGVVCLVTVFIIITDSNTISSSFLNGRTV
ncbi:MauE/DoxX family redox-associated membrane protein [Flavobacterium dauae]|uniref:MauE/DoxX family redox-associated membrane protein n=1 Tax=Flavobacterium dauae TaxID=1563479 RepID=UPI00101B41FE